jgi:hypothetical protein
MRRFGGYALVIIGWWVMISGGAVPLYYVVFLATAPDRPSGVMPLLGIALLMLSLGWVLRRLGLQLLRRTQGTPRELKVVGWLLAVLGVSRMLTVGRLSDRYANWFVASEALVGLATLVIGGLLVAQGRRRGQARYSAEGAPATAMASSINPAPLGATRLEVLDEPSPMGTQASDQEKQARPTRPRIPRVAIAFVLGILFVVLPVLSSLATADNWFPRLTGRHYSQGQYDEARAEANSTGWQEGHKEGYSEGFRKGHRDGRTTGYESGKIQGERIGFSTGFRSGCLQLFNGLDTDRVMDFWDFHYEPPRVHRRLGSLSATLPTGASFLQ